MAAFLEEIGGPFMAARIGEERVLRSAAVGELVLQKTLGDTFRHAGGRSVCGGRYLLRHHRKILAALNFTTQTAPSRGVQAVLSNLVVDAAHRRRGHASLLLDAFVRDFPHAMADEAMTADGAAFLGYGPTSVAAAQAPRRKAPRA